MDLIAARDLIDIEVTELGDQVEEAMGMGDMLDNWEVVVGLHGIL